MKGKSSERDPFAGYKPVKVGVPVVDIFESTDDKPAGKKGKKYKFGRGRESGTLSRTVVLALILVVSAVLVFVIGAFSFGIMYNKPVQEVAPELADYAEDIKPLADAGRSVRKRVLGAVSSGREMLGSRTKPVAAVNQPAAPKATNQITAVASGIVSVSTYKEKVQVAEDASAAGATAVAEPLQELEQVVVKKAASRKLSPANVKKSSDSTVDPRLKEFYNGGRRGRKVGDGNIREFYRGGEME